MIVSDNIKTCQRHGKCIATNKKYKEYNHSFPVFYGKNNKKRNEKQNIFNIVNVQNIPDAKFIK